MSFFFLFLHLRSSKRKELQYNVWVRALGSTGLTAGHQAGPPLTSQQQGPGCRTCQDEHLRTECHLLPPIYLAATWQNWVKTPSCSHTLRPNTFSTEQTDFMWREEQMPPTVGELWRQTCPGPPLTRCYPGGHHGGSEEQRPGRGELWAGEGLQRCLPVPCRRPQDAPHCSVPSQWFTDPLQALLAAKHGAGRVGSTW